MYLSKKQEEALSLALQAMDGFRGGLKSEEECEAYDTIVQMLDSSRKEKRKRNNNGRNKRYQSGLLRR